MAETVQVCDQYEYQSPIAVAARFDPVSGAVKYENKYSSIQKDWFCIEGYDDEKGALKTLEAGKKKLTQEREQLKFIRWTKERKWSLTGGNATGVGKTYQKALVNLLLQENKIAYFERHNPR